MFCFIFYTFFFKWDYIYENLKIKFEKADKIQLEAWLGGHWYIDIFVLEII